MAFSHAFDPDLPGCRGSTWGRSIGGRGRDYNLRGAYTVSDFCPPT